MAEEEKGKAKIRPHILILYQGPRATDYRTHVVEKLKGCGAEPAEVAFDGETYRDDVKIYERVRNAIEECDAAIALVTLDLRAASAFGNLWFEIGQWLAVRPRQTIRIMRQAKPKDWDTTEGKEWPVRLPTDLEGDFSPEFRSNGDLTLCVERFVRHIRDLMSPHVTVDTHTEAGVFLDKFKIQDILVPESALWSPEEVHLCQERPREPKCPYREESVGLLCELLRMRKHSWEHWLLEVCFQQLYHLSLDALNADYVKGNVFEKTTKRQEAIDKIHEIVCLLVHTADDSMKWPAAKPIGSGDAWEKLSAYMLYRLNLGHYVREQSPPDDLAREMYRDDVSLFCSWAKQLARSDYKKHLYYEEGFAAMRRSRNTSATNMFRRFHKCHGIAEAVWKALATLRVEFFSACEHAIGKNVEKLTDGKLITQSMGKMRRSLPQNQVDSPLPRIWPMSERDTQLQRASAGL
ncbi:MAG: hypothetical protein JSW47_14260 [Phycisphaerales bacterium]|nr:MAG: hypothetical protein JSW47_14260 [Phycisphaerales bacterium]